MIAIRIFESDIGFGRDLDDLVVDEITSTWSSADMAETTMRSILDRIHPCGCPRQPCQDQCSLHPGERR